jgi:hypothetical protein
MNERHRGARALARLIGSTALGLAGLAPVLHAADHEETPTTKADPAADIADVYCWHSDGKLIVAVTIDGLTPPVPGQRGTYDADVLYSIHIDDSDADDEPDHDIRVRFGRNGEGEWGMKVEGLPGVAEPIVGPVETTIAAGGGRYAFAGLRDDPFFFDLDGFKATVQSGSLSFQNTRDTFAGLNATAIVLQMNYADALGTGAGKVWASTARK